MTFETRSIAGTVTLHPTFKSAWDLYEQSRTSEDEESLSSDDPMIMGGSGKLFHPGLIWRISFDDGIHSHRWVHAIISELVYRHHDLAQQDVYLDRHEEEIKQRGVHSLMEEISSRKIRILRGLSETFANAVDVSISMYSLNVPEMDQVLWLDQPLEPAEYRYANGFFKIIDVLTEDEFKAKYYPQYSLVSLWQEIRGYLYFFNV